MEIAGHPVTEGYAEAILDPEGRIARLRAAAEATDPADARRSGALAARIAAIEGRLGEVDSDVRTRVLRARSELLRDGVPVETDRRIGLEEAPRPPGVPDPRGGELTHPLAT